MSRNSDDRTRFQSGILLPFARRAFLLLSGLAFVAMLGALSVAAYFWLTSPSPIAASSEVRPALSTTRIKSALEAPAPLTMSIFTLDESNRGVSGVIVAEISSEEPGNVIVSATVPQLADNNLFYFELPNDGESNTIKIFTNSGFWESFDRNQDTGRSIKEYEITVQYTDQRAATGNASFRFYVPFRIAKLNAAPTQPKSADHSAPPTNAEMAAEKIAELIDPDLTTYFFDAYSNALNHIRACGANEDDFAKALIAEVQNYPEHFSATRAIVSIDRVCTQWKSAVAAAVEERNAFMRQRQQDAAEAAKRKGWAMTSLIVSLVALAAFFVVIFPLSHLAMEDHLRVIRDKQ